MSANLIMREAAAMVGLSYDRFRKVWRELVARDGLPMPYLGYLWDADALKAWKRERSRRQLQAPGKSRGRSPVATDDVAARARARRQRQELQELRASAPPPG